MAYCTQEDIEELFGKTNVVQWADLDNTRCGSRIRTRINEAIIQAGEEVDMFLRDGPYDLPISPVTEYIKKIAATLAGVNLYNARGLNQSLLAGNRAWAHDELTKLKQTDRRLDTLDVTAQAPVNVEHARAADVPRSI